MKKIEAIVRASKFEELKNSLGEKDINFFTFYEVKGYGHQKSQNLSYRGSVYDLGYIARIKLEIVVSDEFVKEALACIKEAAYTGEQGDGLIIITAIEQITNIRTGLTNSEAINK